jgi:hypothetical protein
MNCMKNHIETWGWGRKRNSTYGPLIDTALYVMLLMWANPLLGQMGGGWALEISTYLSFKWNLPKDSMPFHRAQKSLDFQGPTPSNLLNS